MIDIDRLILELKINQKQLANFLGKSPQSITKVKQGEMEFPKEWKAAILKEYGINVDNYETNTANDSETNQTNSPRPKRKRNPILRNRSICYN